MAEWNALLKKATDEKKVCLSAHPATPATRPALPLLPAALMSQAVASEPLSTLASHAGAGIIPTSHRLTPPTRWQVICAEFFATW